MDAEGIDYLHVDRGLLGVRRKRHSAVDVRLLDLLVAVRPLSHRFPPAASGRR